jgi:diguanylate cyclase (GGDEF)-like protein
VRALLGGQGRVEIEDRNMLDAIAVIMVVAGIGILLAAFPPALRLIEELPKSEVRRRWQVLAGVIAVFIVGYIAYIILFYGSHRDVQHLVAPLMFLLAAGFVQMVVALTLSTTHDVQRVAALEHETITDALTGLRNRRFLDLRLAEEMSRAERYGTPVSVLLLDIDHFKSVNDTCGHAVGDKVLVEVARILHETVRKTDLAARYGGEEMAVIAPQTPLATAVMLAERVRRNIETKAREAVPGVEALNRPITVSIGVAKSSNPVESASKLLWRADSALYEAKGGGRNRVVADSPEAKKAEVI